MPASRRPTISAGVALIRQRPEQHDPEQHDPQRDPGPGGVEVLLVHPGGPFWRNKDEHAWSIPKGLVEADDETDENDSDHSTTARREFQEETGHAVPEGRLLTLEPFRIGSGKVLQAFVARGDLDAEEIVSNTFEMEWPPRSGRTQVFPEVDRGAWFSLDEARTKLHKGQVKLVDLIEGVLEQLMAQP